MSGSDCASPEFHAVNPPPPDSVCRAKPAGSAHRLCRALGRCLQHAVQGLTENVPLLLRQAAPTSAGDPDDAPPGPAVVTVRSLPGEVLAVFEPGPPTVEQLKSGIEERTSCPPALQRLVVPGSLQPLADGEPLPEGEGLEVMLIVDETPLFTWDVQGNPDHVALTLDGAMLRCPKLQTDFVNVHTREPVRSGVHYFQFVMHAIGDEQWCGVVTEHTAGRSRSGRSLSGNCHGRLYYCGRRRGVSSRSLVDGHAALHAENHAVASFEQVRSQGDVIGMLLDLGAKAMAFDLNGELQGACGLPDGPLWLLTHLDRREDCVELRKPPLAEAPEACRASLAGPLLDLAKGATLWATLDATRSK